MLIRKRRGFTFGGDTYIVDVSQQIREYYGFIFLILLSRQH